MAVALAVEGVMGGEEEVLRFEILREGVVYDGGAVAGLFLCLCVPGVWKFEWGISGWC